MGECTRHDDLGNTSQFFSRLKGEQQSVAGFPISSSLEKETTVSFILTNRKIAYYLKTRETS